MYRYHESLRSGSALNSTASHDTYLLLATWQAVPHLQVLQRAPWARLGVMESYSVLDSCSLLAWYTTDIIRALEDSRLMMVQIFITWVLRRYNNELQTSEMFSTAGRTVKSGLVASAVVSSWTWAATLLQSSSVAFRYGMDYLREIRFLRVQDVDTVQVSLARYGMPLVLPYRFCCLPLLLSS